MDVSGQLNVSAANPRTAPVRTGLGSEIVSIVFFCF